MTVAVGTPQSPTIPVPTADTSARSSNTAFDKCYLSGSTDCAETGSFSASDVTYDDGTPSGTTLPSWITFSSTGNKVQTITVSPTDGTHTGDHNIKVIFDSTYGPNPDYTALTITVTCQVTSVAPPAAPTTNLEYIVYDATNSYHDFTSSTWAQTPDCGYAVTNSFSWEGVDASSALTASGAALSVYTTQKSQAAVYTVKLSNTLTIASNGPAGSTTFTPSADSDKTVFDITVTDPCTTATINSLSFSPSTVSVEDGSSTTVTFSVPTNSVMDTHSDPALLCGSTSFQLFEDTSDTALQSAWAVLSGPVSGVYTITIDTTVD